LANDDLINGRDEINHHSASRKEILQFNYYKYDEIRQLFSKGPLTSDPICLEYVRSCTSYSPHIYCYLESFLTDKLISYLNSG
jgi:hypothetical protein